MTALREHAIVVAGGKGTRIKSAVPKQFLELQGKPILMHTLQAFLEYSADIHLVLVLPEDDMARWAQLCDQHSFSPHMQLVKGGATRFQSVRNGLDILPEDGLVAIHDGVRPLISSDIIGASFRLAAAHGTAVAAVRLKESLRVTDQDTTIAVDRSKYRLIQTPQTFGCKLIKDAYRVQEVPSMTDDASVAEHAGHLISLFEGSYENIKITTPEDLIVAESLLKGRFS